MYKKLLLLLAGVLSAGSVSTAMAQATWLIQPSIVSEYMFRGMRLGGTSFQPTIEMNNGAFKLGAWANSPISDEVPGQSDPEIDLYTAWTITLSEGKATLVPGATMYLYPSADESLGFYKSTFEPNIALNLTLGKVTLTPKVYWDMVMEGPTLELGAAFSIPLEKTSFDFSATIGTFKWDNAFENSTPETKIWGDYWSIGVSMPFQVAPNQKLTIGAAYAKGTDNFIKTGTAPQVANTGAVGKGYGTISYGITF